MCSALVALVAAGLPVAASAALARPPVTGALVQDVELNSTGCPQFLGTALDGAHCVPWPVSFDPQMGGNDKECSEALFMLVPLNANVDEYVVSWSWDTPEAHAHPWTFTATGGPKGSGSGPYGEEQWSTTALTPANTGVNVNYTVPTGLGAWFVAAGGGPGPCKANTGVAQGWAVTYKREISGRLTVQGSGGLPAPGVTVGASCPSGGTTTTDQDGRYEFLVDKGSCTIAPQLKPGDIATPQQRVVDVTSGSHYNVDFLVPCDAVVFSSTDNQLVEGARRPAGEILGTLTTKTATSNHSCALTVTVQQLQPLRSGLAVDKEGGYGPVNFTVGTAAEPYTERNEAGQRCMSGCANLLITVTDALTHKPVEGATVEASLSRTAADSRSQGDPYGNEFLCIQSDKPVPDCGDGVSYNTDAKGHVHLLYWTPGVSPGPSGSGWSVTLKVTAHKCGVASCSLHQQSGKAKPMTLTAQPYVIYQHTGQLGAKEVALLVKLAQEPDLIVFELAADHYAETLIEQALETLELFEEHAASIAGAAGLVVSTVVKAVEASTKLKEQRGLIATLLVAEDLSTLGLGEDVYANEVPVDANLAFRDAILNNLGIVPTPFNPKTLEPDGVLWSDANALSTQAKELPRLFSHPPVQSEQINLKVYEVSHCDEGYPLCGPGYRDLPAQAQSTTVENHHGIQPELCFYFTGYNGLPGLDWTDHFCIGYDAPFWVDTQPGLNNGLAPSPPPSASSPSGTVANGDFSQPVVSAGLMYQGYPAGSTAIPGWTIGGDGVEVYASSFMQHPAGTTSEVRLFGGGPGNISQTIATTPGKPYVLKWYGAGEPGGGQAVKTMHVFWNGRLVASPTFDTTGRSFTDMGWRALQVTATATAPTSTIEFADATPDKSFWGSMVTGVSLHASS